MAFQCSSVIKALITVSVRWYLSKLRALCPCEDYKAPVAIGLYVSKSSSWDGVEQEMWHSTFKCFQFQNWKAQTCYFVIYCLRWSLFILYFPPSQRNVQHQQHLCHVGVNRLMLGMVGATASTVKAVTRRLAPVRLVALWKEASATKSMLATRMADKHLALPDRPSASAAAGAFHPSTPPLFLQLPSWGAAALSADSTKDPLEMVVWFSLNL